MSDDPIRNLLTNSLWFDGIEPDDLEEIASHCHTRRYGVGELVYVKGDQPQALYCVLEGQVKVSTLAQNGKEALLLVAESGDWFGAISVLDGQPQHNNATVSIDATVMEIPRKELMALLERVPHFYKNVVRTLCNHARITLAFVEDVNFLKLPARLAKRILMLTDMHGKQTDRGIEIQLHLPQEMIGQMVAASRQSISKELSEWQKQGWIDLQYGHITVLDRPALQELVSSGC